jgi:hypothetical protein
MRIVDIGEGGSDISRKFEGAEIDSLDDADLLLILRKGHLPQER